jgi:putative transposase
MCGVLGVSRDAFYKREKRVVSGNSIREVTLELVRSVRADEPRTGTRKLHHRIEPELRERGLKVGRDRLFKVLREEELLVKPRKKFTRTTYSRHRYAVAANVFKNATITQPNQAFVSDITYLNVGNEAAYLFLVTDVFSRKIVGYHLSRDLSHYSALQAVGRALDGVKSGTQALIHHSDRGCQYCCHEYLDFLHSYGVISSMTDESHCYQNAIAERVNGILKGEFFLDQRFSSFDSALHAVHRAVRIYNTKRTHWSLGLQTPEEIYASAA